MAFENITFNYLCDNVIAAGNYIFKVSNRNNGTRCEICPELTIKKCHQRRFGIFIANFEHISQFVLKFLLLTLNWKIPYGMTVLFFVIGFLGIGRAKEEIKGEEKAVDEAEIELKDTETKSDDKVRNCPKLLYICVWNLLHSSDLGKAFRELRGN